MLKVHIVDDDLSVREACHFLLESLGYEPTCWADGQSFLNGAPLHEQGVAILDMRMPNLTGSQVHEQLRALNSTLAVIILTGHGEVTMAVNELKAGAVDFLQKPVAMGQLMHAMQQAAEHTSSRHEAYQLGQRYALLSPKEQGVAQLVAAGKTNRMIADELCVSVRTVEVQRASAMEKMGTDTLAAFIQSLQILDQEKA
ncbi:MAG: response regulator transcription factor [Neisseriaceae bacterium]|nr:response regulator transcription factor [Neisseriaceae bacterium]MBP6862507.1 response regulator transcription factor [Neisseriaceae bacterium]